VQIRIEAHDLPGRSCAPSWDVPGGYHNIHVGVPRRDSIYWLTELVPGDADTATWTLDCYPREEPDGIDFKGPCVYGPRHGRFIYLSWGTVGADGNFTMFRRAKLWLGSVPYPVAAQAMRQGLLVGRLGLTDDKGHPRCARVQPPVIEWTAPAPGQVQPSSVRENDL
jgi:Family of unknown function (DUF5990)